MLAISTKALTSSLTYLYRKKYSAKCELVVQMNSLSTLGSCAQKLASAIS